MAQIEETRSRHGSGKAKLSRRSLRVDLTPMVDLGFLLITFFIANEAEDTESTEKCRCQTPAKSLTY